MRYAVSLGVQPIQSNSSKVLQARAQRRQRKSNLSGRTLKALFLSVFVALVLRKTLANGHRGEALSTALTGVFWCQPQGLQQ
jgi:hypothetical protein